MRGNCNMARSFLTPQHGSALFATLALYIYIYIYIIVIIIIVVISY